MPHNHPDRTSARAGVIGQPADIANCGRVARVGSAEQWWWSAVHRVCTKTAEREDRRAPSGDDRGPDRV